MLCVPGLDRKVYWDQLKQGPLPEIACPTCETALCGHGWYPRRLDDELIEIRRLRCRRCGVTHALLPEDVCAYQDLTLPALEVAKQEAGPAGAARAVGRAGAVRRARRWRHSGVWQQLLALLPAPGDLWQRIRTLIGPESGMLVRLRHWVWSQLGYLLGGPAGLFRHGQPPRHLRRVST